MPETNKKRVTTYPTPEQYEVWDDEADEMDMSVSKWIQAMVEAGRKKFDARVELDESARELRQQRNDLKEELDHARDRVEELEAQLHQGEQATIEEFIEDNPGATFGDVVQRVIDTSRERVTRHLEELEGNSVRVDDGQYYPASNEGDGQ